MDLKNQESRVNVLQDRVIYVRELENPTPDAYSHDDEQSFATIVNAVAE